ncbi:MAG: histidinol-phosphatase [SAR324 cluster bacterium]|nr:histidinol-phosphatase [SAR324 cluster bacterium]
MSNTVKTPEIFKYGSTWLRADFHLHTKADKEFSYFGNEDYYFSNYVDGLAKAGIWLGVISNHNKFDVAEFNALWSTAKKKEICLLPGVELSVNDGSNGVHTLIVFSDQWLENGNDYISPVITTMFPGKAESEYQNENGRSDKNILQAVEELEKTGRDYFLIFAHVEQKSGLWCEMGGGKLGDFKDKRYEIVRRRTLGFQKVRTQDKADTVCRTKVKGWLGNWYPAEVEGSDCKTIADIGNGRSCYLKLGAFSFDAVKFSLIDKENRVGTVPIEHKHSHIRSIRFTGGTLMDQELHFSPELNTLIGSRGSGKSSVLEVLRYALEIPFGEKTSDQQYKHDLVGFTLGSGGKVEIDAIDHYGQQYTIRRVWKENYSEVLIDGKFQPGVSIRETVLRKPIYFGQKDLSSRGEGFEKDLVDKLLGSKLDEVRRNISQQKQKVTDAVDRLLKVSSVQDQIDDQKKIKQDTEHRLNFYKEYGIEEKLQKRLDFDTDVRMINKGIQLTANFVTDLENLLALHEDELRNFRGYQSKHNEELFKKFYQQYESYVSFIVTAKTWLSNEKSTKQALIARQTELTDIRKGMVEEFAEIERRLAEELKSSGTQNISSDEFLSLKKKLATATQLIDALEKQGDQKKTLQNKLLVELQTLNELWLQEFNLIKDELDKVGGGSSSISITSGYKEEKNAFLSFMKDMFKGSGIRETTYKEIADQYVDFVAIYKDFENAQKLFGSNPQTLADLFVKNLKFLLTYQTPNKFTIHYRGKELQHHSLGQRASALILFVLSQRENDVIIIDQPEDDLDNQTIYEDVIKLIRQMKPEVQFIFATHNPNIPVLGDAELVHACSFMDDTETISSGSVDNHETQKTIVKIMEGGKEAFDRRKEIYQIWKS